jgi:hypothetical protein
MNTFHTITKLTNFEGDSKMKKTLAICALLSAGSEAQASQIKDCNARDYKKIIDKDQRKKCKKQLKSMVKEKKAKLRSKKVTKKGGKSAPTSQMYRKMDLGFGLGFHNLIPPAAAGSIHYSYDGIFEIGFEGGGMNLVTSEFSVATKFQALDVRFSPFRDALFIGLGYGTRTFTVNSVDEVEASNTDGDGNTTVTNYELNYKFILDQTYVTPRVGWRQVFDNGAAITMALGVAVPTEKESTASIDSGTMAESSLGDGQTFATLTEAKREEIAKHLESPLPLLSLRFSWYVDAW